MTSACRLCRRHRARCGARAVPARGDRATARCWRRNWRQGSCPIRAPFDPDLPIGVAMRRARRREALIVAIADLAGALDLNGVTQRLTAFADRALDAAIRAAILERTPDAEPDRLRRDRARQAGQLRAQLFVGHRSDPAVRPRDAAAPPARGARRKPRSASAAAWSNCSRRATARVMCCASICGCARRPRPRRSRCRSTPRFPITNRRRCRGSARRSSARAPPPATWRSGGISSMRSARSCGAARSISARSARSARSRAASAITIRKGRRSAPATTSSAGAAASARSNSSRRSTN